METPTAAEISEAIRHAGWSRAQFARQVGVTPWAVGVWERGGGVSPARLPDVWRAIRTARAATAAPPRDARQALVAILAGHQKGLTRTQLTGWRLRYQLRPSEADAIIRQAIAEGEIHQRLEARPIRPGQIRTVRWLVAGPAPSTTVAELSADGVRVHLVALRRAARLTSRDAAELVGVPVATYRSWENGDAEVPVARVPTILQGFESAAPGIGPVAAKADQIVAGIRASPGISWEVLARQWHRVGGVDCWIGDSATSRTALAQILESGRVHRRLVERPRRRSYVGFFPGPMPALPEFFGHELRTLRQQAGLLQREIATAAGVAPSQARNWEQRNARIPTRHHAPIRDVLANPEPVINARPPRRIARSARAPLSIIVDLLDRYPEGLSRGELLARLPRHCGIAEALDQGLRSGAVIHEQRHLMIDARGHHRVSTRIQRGPGTTTPRPLPPQGDDIRHLRRARGLNQTEFGELLGVSQAAISAWEQGTPIPEGRLAALDALLQRLRVEYDT